MLHLSGPQRGQTITYDGTVVAVGSAADADVRLPVPQVAPHHAVIEFDEPACSFLLRRKDGQVFVNNQEIEEVILNEGDLLEWGAGGPRARFRHYVANGRVCKPVRKMLADAREVQQASGHGVATTALARDLLTKATLRLKIGLPLLLLAIGLPLAFLAGWLEARPDLSSVRTADAITRGQLDKLRAAQERATAELAHLAQANTLVQRIQEKWSHGVCLVHGMVAMRRPGGDYFVDAGGDRIEFEYTGSGFLAAADGTVITNRHVVTPWDELDETKPMLKAGGVPEFVHLTATFPGRPPIDIDPATIRRRSDKLDVAAFVLPAGAVADLPALPLHGDDLSDLGDRHAIVVGFPTGLAALLVQADAPLVDRLRAEGATMTLAIERLAAADSIAPTVTEGIFSLTRPDLLTYDAATTHGGSGGPVFGADGTVIGVNFAILPGFSGKNFGVPIRFARELLRH
ncbi:MAG TPA: trypsin-like peptidase domain-containing protein [Planctomycetota bacterium]|nr:trypsin-like peptidase domain-containing protein [Planctomycetota bacterium]